MFYINVILNNFKNQWSKISGMLIINRKYQRANHWSRYDLPSNTYLLSILSNTHLLRLLFYHSENMSRKIKSFQNPGPTRSKLF